MPTNRKSPAKAAAKQQPAVLLKADVSGYRALMREREALDERIASFAAMRMKAIEAVRTACEKYGLTEQEVFGSSSKPQPLSMPEPKSSKAKPSKTIPVKAATNPVAKVGKTTSAAVKKTPATKNVRAAKTPKAPAKKSPAKSKAQLVSSSAARETSSKVVLTLEKRTSGAKPSNNKGIANANPLPFTVPK